MRSICGVQVSFAVAGAELSFKGVLDLPVDWGTFDLVVDIRGELLFLDIEPDSVSPTIHEFLAYGEGYFDVGFAPVADGSLGRESSSLSGHESGRCTHIGYQLFGGKLCYGRRIYAGTGIFFRHHPYEC